MDHRVAEEQNAVEKYLLDEFTAEERMDFEAHLFDCAICGEQARQSAIAIANMKAVFREEHEKISEPAQERARWWGWRAWSRMPALVPSLAALALASVVAYQHWVSIPALEQPQVLSSTSIAPLARDEAPVITTDPTLPKFNLDFLVDVPQAYPAYECEFRKEGGATVLKMGSGPKQVGSFTLNILLPTKEFPPGRYVMVLRPATALEKELQRYSFVIQQGGHNEQHANERQ